jgi:redox-sensitive bicupin YhaK (pirin superfamily)
LTVVLDGEITHADSMGNKDVIKAGDVQRMSAGTGLTHSEFNLAEKPVHFYQIWIYPDEAGLEPSYDRKSFDPGEWRGRLLPVASGQGFAGAVTFHTDATIYRGALEAGQKIEIEATAGRRIFIYLTSGRLDVNGRGLGAKEQARIDTEDPLVLEPREDSDLILIDVPSCKGWGYDEETLKGRKT